MNFIDSNECFKYETDIFSTPTIQTTVESGSWESIAPLNGFETGTLEFNIAPTDEYIDLSETELYLKVSIRKKGSTDETQSSPIVESDEIGPINNFGSSIFDQVQLFLNNTQVENSNGSYAYRCYFEKLLSFCRDAKTSHGISQLFIKDDSGRMNHLNIRTEESGEGATKIVKAPNTGFVKRREAFVKHKTLEFCGPLHIDLFNTNKYLLNKIPIRLTFSRSKNEFCLMGKPGNNQYFTFIEQALLLVRKVSIAPSIMANHIKKLENSNAIYPLRRVVVKYMTLKERTTTEVLDNIYVGKMPRRVIVGFVKHTGISGSFSENPFYFQHFGLEKINLIVAGHNIPYRKDLEFDFDKKQCIRGYNTLFKGLNRTLYETGNDITLEDYVDGYTLFAFNLAPDLCDGDHWSIPKTGDLKLDVKFKNELPFNISAVFYLEFDNTIEITNYRQVLFDYKV